MPHQIAITFLLIIVFSMINNTASAENRIDTIRPDAPELAAYGDFNIGVRKLDIVNPHQIDILKIDPDKPKPNSLPSYDRPLTVEVWYPAALDSEGKTSLDVYLRDGKTKVELHGKAVRDAEPFNDNQKFPLVLISHGYSGNRFLLSPLAENIASKGYVVAAIDHTDSTYRSYAAFGSTLVNRPLDQLFTLNQIDLMSEQKTSFLYNLVDAKNTALIGYSMGGYGAVIMAGGGVTQKGVDYSWSAPHKTLSIHKSGSQSHNALTDSRLKTIITFAPWGMNHDFFDKTTLKGVSLPVLIFAGSEDDVSGYEDGIRSIWQSMSNIDRSLLTFENASHGSGAPMPAPEESFVFNEKLGFNLSDHYSDSVWDSVRMNNISQHFVTAWLAKYLKNSTEMDVYFNLEPNSNDGIWAKDENGDSKPEHTYWEGFPNRTAKGLRFESRNKGK